MGFVFREFVVLVFVEPKPIVFQTRDATLAAMHFAVRQSAPLMTTVERFMVKIADTPVLTAKNLSRSDAGRTVIPQSTWILILFGSSTFHVQC